MTVVPTGEAAEVDEQIEPLARREVDLAIDGRSRRAARRRCRSA